MCLLTMHATLNGNMLADSNNEFQSSGRSADPTEILPSEEEYKELLAEHANFLTTDPSDKYDITSRHKLGIGGFAKVFRVVRREDKL